MAEWLWVFDLDNTLHDAGSQIFPRISQEMAGYLQRYLGLNEQDARALRDRYWKHYGATLRGLIRHHGVDSAHFLRETHPLHDLLDCLQHESGLARHLARLRGRKVLFSNAPRHYVDGILQRAGIERQFDSVWGIEDVRLQPKPAPSGYRRIMQQLAVSPGSMIMVEDSLDNLRTAKRLGMRTVWISRARHRPAFVDAVVRNIAALTRVGWVRRGPQEVSC